MEVNKSDEFQLCEIDAQSPAEVLRGGSKQVPLPLSEQDRDHIQRRFRERHRSRWSLSELLLLVTGIAVLLAPVQWMPLSVYALSVGMLALLLLIGLRIHIPHRYRTAVTTLLLIFYLAIVVTLIIRDGL